MSSVNIFGVGGVGPGSGGEHDTGDWRPYKDDREDNNVANYNETWRDLSTEHQNITSVGIWTGDLYEI